MCTDGKVRAVDQAAARRGCCEPAPIHTQVLSVVLRERVLSSSCSRSVTQGAGLEWIGLTSQLALVVLRWDFKYRHLLYPGDSWAANFLLEWRPKESRRVSGINLGFHSCAYGLRKVYFGVHFGSVV